MNVRQKTGCTVKLESKNSQRNGVIGLNNCVFYMWRGGRGGGVRELWGGGGGGGML